MVTLEFGMPGSPPTVAETVHSKKLSWQGVSSFGECRLSLRERTSFRGAKGDPAAPATFAGEPHPLRPNCRKLSVNAIPVPEVRPTEPAKSPANGNPCRDGVYFAGQRGSIRSRNRDEPGSMPIWQVRPLTQAAAEGTGTTRLAATRRLCEAEHLPRDRPDLPIDSERWT